MALKFPFRWRLALALNCGWLALVGTWPAVTHGASPSAEQALKLAPVQRDVDYDRPAPEQAARCTIKAEKHNGQTGWIVRDAGGKILREFVDTNGDNIVDRWSYYKDGVEVYRDIDARYKGKATEFRWLNGAGMRWGVSKAGDGRIDYWRAISPEEVSAEAVAALREHDPGRFDRLLLTPAELKSLGFNATQTKKMSDKLAAAPEAFNDLARLQHTVGPKTNWVQFVGTRPGAVPAGTFGAPADLSVYENVVAVIETEGQSAQIQIGTMIKVGDCWRLVDAPAIVENGNRVNESQGYFFTTPYRIPSQSDPVAGDPPTDKVQKLMERVRTLGDAIGKAAPDDQARLNEQRADFLEQSVNEIGEKDRAQWIRQMADILSEAVQSGSYPKGAERINALAQRLANNPADAELAAYVEFRGLSAEYAQALQAPNPNISKIQSAWLDSLEKFVGRHPNSPDAADALLQLGIAEDFDGHEEKAKRWYQQILDNFNKTPVAAKAAGAIRRLDSIGKPIKLVGKSTAGDQIDVANYAGKFVVVHYWATSNKRYKVDLAELKELQAKYASEGLVLIGISLDDDRQALDDYLATNRIPWPQLYEPGGLDSRYGNEMGIITLPTIMLIDDKGRVINRNVDISELDNELKAKLKN